MKIKSLFLYVLIFGVIIIPDFCTAEPAIVKNIDVNAQGMTVEISISSNKILQIESFKSEESFTNYIVLDFLGTVYTDLPPLIEVSSGAVGRISLVRGEEEQIQIKNKDYYPIDFLAINLLTLADYEVKQNKSVISLEITKSADLVKDETIKTQDNQGDTIQKTVELKPPIIISKEKDEELKKERAQQKNFAKNNTTPVKTIEKKKTEKTEKQKKQNFFNKIWGKPKKHKEKNSYKEENEKKENEQVTPANTEQLLIDKIVKETIKQKEKTSTRIEYLTDELKRMQQELDVSKEDKLKLENKIKEILAKLDQIKDSIDMEIKRRQALGEKVDDLIAKKEIYINAKKTFEDFAQQLANITRKVDNLNLEVNTVKGNLDGIRFEKKKLEEDIDTISMEYSKLKADYEDKMEKKKNVLAQIDDLTRKLEELRQMLDKTIADKDVLLSQLKNLENKSADSESELARIKQMLSDRNESVLNFSQRYEQLKDELEKTVAEKVKIEFAYRNAKTEYDKIKREIERFLEKK